MDMSLSKSKRMKDEAEKTERKLSKEAIDVLEEIKRIGSEDKALDLVSVGITDEMITELCVWLQDLDSKVNYLCLRSNRITSVGAAILFDSLKASNSQIKQLDFVGNAIGDDCMSSLGEFIKQNKSINYVYLSRNKITDKGIEILAPYLDGNKTFEYLDLVGNDKITMKSMPLIVKTIEHSRMKGFWVYNCNIKTFAHVNVPLAINIIKENPDQFQFSGISIKDDDISKICKAMEKYGFDKLKGIFLSCNEITSKGAITLFDTLRCLKSPIKFIDLSNNMVEDESMNSIGEFIQSSECIEEVHLRDAKITNKGIEILSQYIIGTMILKKLDVSENKYITEDAIEFLVDIAKSSYVTEIKVNGTDIPQGRRKEIAHRLKVNPIKRDIPIQSNTKSAAKSSY